MTVNLAFKTLVIISTEKGTSILVNGVPLMGYDFVQFEEQVGKRPTLKVSLRGGDPE